MEFQLLLQHFLVRGILGYLPGSRHEGLEAFAVLLVGLIGQPLRLQVVRTLHNGLALDDPGAEEGVLTLYCVFWLTLAALRGEGGLPRGGAANLRGAARRRAQRGLAGLAELRGVHVRLQLFCLLHVASDQLTPSHRLLVLLLLSRCAVHQQLQALAEAHVRAVLLPPGGGCSGLRNERFALREGVLRGSGAALPLALAPGVLLWSLGVLLRLLADARGEPARLAPALSLGLGEDFPAGWSLRGHRLAALGGFVLRPHPALALTPCLCGLWGRLLGRLGRDHLPLRFALSCRGCFGVSLAPPRALALAVVAVQHWGGLPPWRWTRRATGFSRRWQRA
mmetsp:Transcript_38653/g.115459  ORF Transcript_38653/g.115459 Transcript_38653/m.115459 type:complete len:337 (-) Transcript_38653:785-1795(-)